MPNPAWDNVDEFFDPDDFGVEATITLPSGVRKINCLFDDPYVYAELGEYAMDSEKPCLEAKESDLVGIKRGTPVLVYGKQYYSLTYPQVRGTGTSVIQLSVANQ